MERHISASMENPARGWNPRGVPAHSKLLLRFGGAAFVLRTIQVAIAVLVGGRKALDQPGIGRGFRHGNAAVLVRIERVERRGISGGRGRVGRWSSWFLLLGKSGERYE